MSSNTSKSKKRTSPTRIILAIVGVIVLGIAAGFVGSGFRGSGSASAASSTDGAFLQGIKDRGELRVGATVGPPLITEKGGKLQGPDLLPLQNLADALGVKLVTVPVDSGQRVAGLQAGRYDFAANLDSTLERSMAIQFTDDVYLYQGVFLVPADSKDVTGADVLSSGGKVAVSQGTAYADPLKKLGYTLLEVGDDGSALENLTAGRVNAEFTDLPSAVGQAQANSKVKIIVPDPVIYQSGAAYGVPNNIDQHSLNVINIAIGESRESGDLSRAMTDVGFLEVDNLGDLQKR